LLVLKRGLATVAVEIVNTNLNNASLTYVWSWRHNPASTWCWDYIGSTLNLGLDVDATWIQRSFNIAYLLGMLMSYVQLQEIQNMWHPSTHCIAICLLGYVLKYSIKMIIWGYKFYFQVHSEHRLQCQECFLHLNVLLNTLFSVISNLYVNFVTRTLFT
jgi:hypothetical protein